MNRESALSAAILAAVTSYHIRRVPISVALVAAAAVDRTAAATVGWRGRVLNAVEDLARQDLIELPATKFDRSAHPPLPAYLTRPAPHRETVPAAGPPVWNAELTWAAVDYDRGELSAPELRTLTAINAWLPERRGITVPMRERSLEIFGDEKFLETVVLGPLFADRRLTWTLLETYPCWPPVEQTVLGPGDWLIVENYTTYFSVATSARALSFDGRVIWGSGNQVGTRLAALADEPKPKRCWYFGDIDAGGFRAARLAASRAADLNLPEVVPAQGLYRLAMELGNPRPSGTARPALGLSDWIQHWFGTALGPAVAAVAAAGSRIVQEHVGLEILLGTSCTQWFGRPADDIDC